MTKLSRTLGGVVGALAWRFRGPVKQHGNADLVNGYAELPRFPAPHVGLATATGHREKQRIEKPEPPLFKRTIENGVVYLAMSTRSSSPLLVCQPFQHQRTGD
jgi:hypothetical protein